MRQTSCSVFLVLRCHKPVCLLVCLSFCLLNSSSKAYLSKTHHWREEIGSCEFESRDTQTITQGFPRREEDISGHHTLGPFKPFTSRHHYSTLPLRSPHPASCGHQTVLCHARNYQSFHRIYCILPARSYLEATNLRNLCARSFVIRKQVENVVTLDGWKSAL